MKLTLQDIDALAALARVDLPDEQREGMRADLESVLGYVEGLSLVDASNVPEVEGEDLAHVLRGDLPRETDPDVRARILENFPDALGDALRVPAVFEKPKV